MEMCFATGFKTSIFIAFIAGFLLGFSIGFTLGWSMGREAGRDPSPVRYTLMVLSLAVVSLGSFISWHYLEAGNVASFTEYFRFPLGPDPEIANRLIRCLTISFTATTIVAFSSLSGVRQGKIELKVELCHREEVEHFRKEVEHFREEVERHKKSLEEVDNKSLIGILERKLFRRKLYG